VRPECVELGDYSTPEKSVPVKPIQPPPGVSVRLEERVPVLERLKDLIPTEYEGIPDIEEKVPEDILFHPYFDCQGGLISIATKFPELFQVVGGKMRRKPVDIAPLAIGEFSFSDSPEPEVIEKVKSKVCATEIPQWISVTSLYETLTVEERRRIKRDFKSFASFLRAHGRSLAVSTDTLSVSRWIVRKDPITTEEKVAVQYTQLHVVNELFEKLPSGKSLRLSDALRLLPHSMLSIIPKNPIPWISSFPNYFTLDGGDGSDPAKTFIQKVSRSGPLDLAVALYKCLPDDGASLAALEASLPASTLEIVKRIGLSNILQTLPEWFEVLDGDVFKKRSLEELLQELKESAQQRRSQSDISREE
jgi:hypothetical protein